MNRVDSETLFRAIVYGGGSVLLLFDAIFLVRALFTSSIVPIVPVLAGILTALGLLLVVSAEHRSREQDKRDHRRISRVAHKLETPLRSVREDFESLLENQDRLPAEAKLKLKQMSTRTKVVLENVRDVFLMLRAQERPLEEEKRTYDLCTLVHDVVEGVRDDAKARNVELIAKAHCATAPVKVNKRLFRIALTHLIENGYTYTTKPGTVNVAITRSPKSVRVVVQDRGIGVTDDDSLILWQPFARGQRAAEYDPDGIGTGLTISRLLIKEFGGSLKYVPRARGAGSQFEISLPLTELR